LVEHITHNNINYQFLMVGQFLLIWSEFRHNPHSLGVGVFSSTSSSISVLMRLLLGQLFFNLHIYGLWQSLGPSYGTNNSYIQHCYHHKVTSALGNIENSLKLAVLWAFTKLNIFNVDIRLITALRERWRPETHISFFHQGSVR